MSPVSFKRAVGTASLLAILVFVATAARAQQDTETSEEEQGSMEEIVVVGNKSGDPVDLEASYEEQLRARIIADYFRQQTLEEEEQWRKSLPTSVEGPGRIRWGYDAQAESRVRREMALTDLPTDTVKPATVISVRF